MQNFLIYLLNGILAAGGGALLAYDIFYSGESHPVRDLQILIVLAGSIAITCGIYRENFLGSYRRYQNTYKDILGDAFSHDKRKRRMLLKAIDYYNRDYYAKAEGLLSSLRKKCGQYGMTAAERCAVGLFEALCMEETGRYEEAIAVYESILKRDQENALVWSNLGVDYEKAGRQEDALRAYQKAVALEPHNGVAYNNLAVCYLYIGKPEKALETALLALQLDSGQSGAIKAAAAANILLGRKRDGERYEKMYVANGGDWEEIRQLVRQLQ